MTVLYYPHKAEMAMASLIHLPCVASSSLPSSPPLPPPPPPSPLSSSQAPSLCLPGSPPSSLSTAQYCCSDELPRSCFSRSLLALLGSFALQGLTPHPTNAFSLGISGPKEWLKGQKKKTSEYLLAPIIASRERLKSAISLAETTSLGNIQEAHKLVKVAARDCIKPEDGSLVAFQAKTGIEVCTFRLILKNAASLLDDADPIKLNADAALDNLISSFSSLDDIISSASEGSSSNKYVTADAFNQTNSALDNFERGVRECLGIS